MTPVSVLDAVAVEIFVVENDENDEPMTEEPLSKKYKNSPRTHARGGGVGGGEVGESLKTVLQSCVQMLFDDFKGGIEATAG